MMDGIKVVSIEAVEEAAIQKNQFRRTFFAPVRYVLEDGRKVVDTYEADRKKDVVAYLAKLPKTARGMSVELDANGNIVSTMYTLSFL